MRDAFVTQLLLCNIIIIVDKQLSLPDLYYSALLRLDWTTSYDGAQAS